MPSPVTALDLIKSSMRLAGITTAGETPTADEANDALSALNDLLESMGTENLFVYSTANETFNTVAGQAVYTIGTGGNFNTTRPVRIADAYCTVNGIDFPVQIIGEEQYNDIPLKTQQQQILEQLLYTNAFPLGLVKLWPTPSAIVPLTLATDFILPAIAGLTTTISLPPGYALYLKNALALSIAPEYGIELSPTVAAVASSVRASLKRANKQKVIARFDAALTDSGPVTWQIGV